MSLAMKQFVQRRLLSASANGASSSSTRAITAHDFIADSLYNSSYGYFAKEAKIFELESPLRFGELEDNDDVLRRIAARYREYDKHAHAQGRPVQVWHTPTEIFRPLYGGAVARYILEKHAEAAGGPLRVYEIGAGNGTLMVDILDHLRAERPDVYATSEYTVIEISQRLHERQRARASAAGHSARVRFVAKSIFDWEHTDAAESFFVAMEVLVNKQDNFAHDIIRYDLACRPPKLLQAIVSRAPNGGFLEEYTEHIGKELSEYMAARPTPSPLLRMSALRSLLARHLVPHWLWDGLSRREHVPTSAHRLVRVLNAQFPRSRLIISDFARLDDTIAAGEHRAPVVQTRLRGQMVPCSTYLLMKGFFDIFYPTDFSELRTLLRRGGTITRHGDFMARYADMRQARTRSGEIPARDMYANVEMLLT